MEKVFRSLPLYLIMFCCGVASAATIPFFSTGLGSGGSDDPNWTVTIGSSTAGAKIISDPNVWFAWAPNANGSGSRWIAPVDSLSEPPGPYTYTQNFDMTGLDLASALISGLWYMDDIGAMYLNGHQIGTTEIDTTQDPGGIDSNAFLRVPFSITGASGFFVDGVNTFTIEVPNSPVVDQFADGLRISVTTATADATDASAPEPKTIWLAFAGAGLLGMTKMARMRRGSRQ